MDTVTINVHTPPVAEAGSSLSASVDEAVSFDGSGSTGNNLSYSWDFGADATPATGSGDMPSCTYSASGDKVATLTVTDTATRLTASDTVTIYVYSRTATLAAEAGSDQTVSVGETVSFDGSGSTGNNLVYSWAFGTDATPTTGSGVTASCTYSTPGAKTVTLTVTDVTTSARPTASDTVTINVHNPPVAEAGDNQTVSVGETVSFDGSDSTGSNLSYSWDFGTDATPATGTGSMPSCTYSTSGTKIVTLTVTDTATGLTASDTATITVHTPPDPDAGDNQTVLVGETVSFDGSGSTGNNLSYSWDFGTDATPATGSGVTPSCSYSTSGTKTVTLTVTSGAISRSATVTITVHNPPICRPGDNQTVLVGETVNFDGSGSSDPDGGELIYSWDFGTDATPATSNVAMPSCSYSTIGVKTVTLTVTDDEGATASATVTITVHNPPIANAGSDQIVAFGSEVSFDGSGSSDPDGGELTYSWDFGTDADPATSNADKPFCLYGSTGDKTVTLTVTDDEGVSRSDTVTITVHNPPIADAGSDQIVTVDTEVNFDGSGSRDPDGGELTYSWDFGADAMPATDTGVTPSCTYTMTGAKTVTLTVTDDEGATAKHTVTITVHDPPVANAGSDQIVAFGSEVSFDGSDSTGNNLSYLWDFGTDADPATSNSDKPFCLYGSTGAKTVSLTVTDRDTGRTDSDTVTITVIDVGVTVAGAPRVVAVTPPTRVNFTGTVSNAPEEATLTYSWNFGDGAIFLRDYGSTASCQYTKPGDQTVTLTVGVTIGEQTVEVEGTCVIRVFKVNVERHQIVAVGDTVDFTGTVLDAPEGADLSYSWAFGDGAANAEDDDGLTPSCSYTTAGEKTVTLTVSFTLDGESIEGSGTVKITVLESQLRVQGPRALSPLERAAFNLVFGEATTPLGEAITPPRIEIHEHIDNYGRFSVGRVANMMRLMILLR